MAEHLNLELTIEALAENRLRITVVRSPVGTATEEIVNTLTADDVAKMLSILDGTTRLSRGDAAKAARNFGDRLFGLIFTGTVREIYLNSKQKAGDDGLRIRLNLDAAEDIKYWPWELLRDPGGDFLALSRATPIVRYPSTLAPKSLIETSLPIRALVLISSPRDKQLIDVEAEWRTLQDATSTLRSRGLLQLDRLDDGQLATMQRALRQGIAYQILHVIGHASPDERSSTGTGIFSLEDVRAEEAQPVTGEVLAEEVAEQNSVRLVVMDANHGPRTGRRLASIDVVAGMLAKGIPAAVLMQFPIGDEASRLFYQEFYRLVCEGYPVETAAAEGRRAIGSALSNLEWAAPALYLQTDEKLIFPRHRIANASTGGLRERLTGPRFIASLAILIVGIFAVIGLLSGGGGPGGPTIPTPGDAIVATLTPTPPNSRGNIELLADSVRFLPVSPAPGQEFKIAMRFRNQGTSDSGPVEWGWWLDDPRLNFTPTLRGVIPDGLVPGQVRSEIVAFRLPWWGRFTTTAYIDFNNRLGDSNPANNFDRKDLESSRAPFVIDFTVLPSGKLLEAGPLEGNEFEPWGFSMSPNPTDNCREPGLKVEFASDASNLVVGQREGTNVNCAGLPVTFTLKPLFTDPAVASMTIEFSAPITGIYALELFNSANQPIQRSEMVVQNAGTVNKITIEAPAGSFIDARAIFSPPPDSKTQIRRVTFALP